MANTGKTHSVNEVETHNPAFEEQDEITQINGNNPPNSTAINIPSAESEQDGSAERNGGNSEIPILFPDELLKTGISFLVLILGFLITSISLSITHERMPDYPPLPDVFLDNAPYKEWGLDVSEYIIVCLTLSAVILVLFHKHRAIVTRRIFLITGILYGYRGLTMYITVLPKPNPEYYCSPKLNSTITFLEVMSRTLKIMTSGGLGITGDQVYCGDFIFSGHTMILLLAFLAIREYSPKKWWFLHGVAILCVVAGVIFLLLARGHYCIDVLLAYWVTTRIWWTYHTSACHTHLKAYSEHNYIGNMWWWHVFRYFECNIGGPLPKAYTVPLPARAKDWIYAKFTNRSGYIDIDDQA